MSAIRDQIEALSPEARRILIERAVGKFLGMLERPFQDGDHETYEICRMAALYASEASR